MRGAPQAVPVWIIALFGIPIPSMITAMWVLADLYPPWTVVVMSCLLAVLSFMTGAALGSSVAVARMRDYERDHP